MLFLFSSLGGEKKSEGRRVNIDAHSVPSQPQSIWIHSSLWRANNLEETLITLSDSLPPFPDLLAAYPPPIGFVFLSVVPLSPHLFKFPPSTPLSLSPPRYTLLAFHVCVPHHNRWIIDDHPWSRIAEIARRCYTHPCHGATALSTGDIMTRPFNKCFYLKWTVICGVFLAETSRGFSLDCRDTRRNARFTLQPARSFPAYRIVSTQPAGPYVGHRKWASGKMFYSLLSSVGK